MSSESNEVSVAVADEFDYSGYDETKTEIPVKYKNRSFVLRKASGKAARIYKNFTLSCFRLGPEGKPTELKGLASAEPLLVSLCLFETTNPQKPYAPVTQELVESFPYDLQKKLFEKAKEISDIAEVTQEREQFLAALSRNDSPVSLEDLRKYVEALPEDEFKQVKAWLKPTPEEKAKNSPSDTTAG